MPNRREFLVTAGGAAAAFAAGCRSGGASADPGAVPHPAPVANPADRLGPLGVGLFTLPKSLEKDFDGTLGMLSGLGYQEVELFGPYPFSTDAAKAGWAATSKTLGFAGSGFFGRTARQVRESLDRHKLTSPSMHVDFDTLRDRTEQIGEAAHEIGWRCRVSSRRCRRRNWRGGPLLRRSRPRRAPAPASPLPCRRRL